MDLLGPTYTAFRQTTAERPKQAGIRFGDDQALGFAAIARATDRIAAKLVPSGGSGGGWVARYASSGAGSLA